MNLELELYLYNIVDYELLKTNDQLQYRHKRSDRHTTMYNKNTKV